MGHSVNFAWTLHEPMDVKGILAWNSAILFSFGGLH